MVTDVISNENIVGTTGQISLEVTADAGPSLPLRPGRLLAIAGRNAHQSGFAALEKIRRAARLDVLSANAECTIIAIPKPVLFGDESKQPSGG